jgi:hypothetical protein
MNGALAGLVILVIGDSHMIFGVQSNFHSQLEANGAVVHSYAMCGATAADWLYPSTLAKWTAGCGRGERHENAAPIIENQGGSRTYVLSELLAKHHPSLVVVELADTMAGYEPSWVLQQVHGFNGLVTANHISCVWVGPVWGQDKPPYNKTDVKVRAMTQLLSESVSPCSFIDSTAFCRPGEWPTKDGTHLAPDGYRRWATELTSAILKLKGQGVLVSR